MNYSFSPSVECWAVSVSPLRKSDLFVAATLVYRGASLGRPVFWQNAVEVEKPSERKAAKTRSFYRVIAFIFWAFLSLCVAVYIP